MQVFYTVRTGDTLSSIASRWRIPLNSLILANNIGAPYTIFPGQQLSMPTGVTTYVVESGDTLSSIAQKYGIPLNVVVSANAIDPDNIVPGQVIIVPTGVPYYVVRSGDTLFNIAIKYNVTVNGQPRPNLIIAANEGLTPSINPGMAIVIPYAPPGGPGTLAVTYNDDLHDYLGLYQPITGALNSIVNDDIDELTVIFWSPNQSKIAAVDGNGIISIIDVNTRRVTKIDQTSLPAFVDWASDSTRVIYSNGRIIRIYNVNRNTFQTILRSGASYVQWFPGGNEIIYEAKDANGISQLYRNNIEGSDERQITINNVGDPMNNVRLSPNGRYVLFTSPGVSISEIYVIDLATGTIIKIPGGPEGKNYNPTWSPDSTKIAYSSTQFINGKYYSLIRVSGATGEGDTTLAISSCFSTPITWSPDSRKIAYLSGCREENPPVEVWSIDIQKPTPTNLLSGFKFFNLDWS